MTNIEKAELIYWCKQGFSFKEIKNKVSCSDKTIRNYMKIFKPIQKEIR